MDKVQQLTWHGPQHAIVERWAPAVLPTSSCSIVSARADRGDLSLALRHPGQIADQSKERGFAVPIEGQDAHFTGPLGPSSRQPDLKGNAQDRVGLEHGADHFIS